MPINASTISLGPVQRDGRRYVIEKHTDGAGVVYVVEYLAAVGVDHSAVMMARASALADHLAEMEAVRLADGP